VEPHTHAEIEAMAAEILSQRKGRPRKISADQIPRLRQIRQVREELRRQLDALPTNQELADELGVCVRTIQEAMR
jgi:DNA-directed RNA polymerase specialized sigma subunit